MSDTKIRFEDSTVFKTGQMYQELGLMMQNPKSTIKDIVEFENKWGQKLDILFLKPPSERT